MLAAAVGTSGSGKTTTIEYLIQNLAQQGHNIGAIKHIHRGNFTIDKEGSNTWRFSRAGSKITVAFSPQEIAIIQNKKTSLDDLDKVIEQLKAEQLDIVFIEGFHDYVSKKPDIAKIITAKSQEDLARTLEMTVPPVLAICGLVGKKKPLQSPIPYFDLPSEGAMLLELIKKHLERH